MGKRVRERGRKMWVATMNFPTATNHSFYTRTNQRLAEHHFDDGLLQMETILETLNEGVVIADDAMCVVFANEVLLRLTGYERRELQGRTPEAIFQWKISRTSRSNALSQSVAAATVTSTAKKCASGCQ